MASALELFPYVEDVVETYEISEANYPFVLEVLENPKLNIKSAYRLDLLLKVGNYKYLIIGCHKDAVKDFEEAINLASSIYPDLKSNAKLATAHENLSKVYVKTAYVQLAHKHLKMALEIKKHIYGWDHPETALAVHCMGNVALAAAKPNDAIEWHEKAIKLRKKLIGPDSYQVS